MTIPWSKEQLMKANSKLMNQNSAMKIALEEIAYKGFNTEPKQVVVKMQSIARNVLDKDFR